MDQQYRCNCTRSRWAQEWAKETTGKPNQRLVKAPDKKVLRLFESLSKPYTSILIQMRSMRIALNHFLFKIKAVESDECYCGEGPQTPRHVLIQCPLYADLRKTFLDKIRSTDLGDSTDYDAIASWGNSDTSKSNQNQQATKTTSQEDWQAQVVKTMGRRNAKPTAD
ncbi:uncharacterized protein N7458_002934 [Penicillium daleae]|uniref:Reverse transcriptase zinc-binding domain-containing protein n=1 Tax=Penicillium daleae TaxID=63821 RepID=A0AAD6CDY7_9EURO|nr:uncharacterized protein N7458_002934 [Penicillium daleae]KAJ5461382.1 hypothetical protein N7458_002934 [Penicillium daleae]